MTTLVTGATGFIGANVVRALLDTGTAVRVLVRHGSDTRNLTGLPVEMVHGDVRDIDSLRPALRGCHTLYHVAAHYSLWTPHPEDIDVFMARTWNAKSDFDKPARAAIPSATVALPCRLVEAFVPPAPAAPAAAAGYLA